MGIKLYKGTVIIFLKAFQKMTKGKNCSLDTM